MVLRRAVALILVIVVAAAALVPPVAALDESRLPILDVITKLSNAWGGFDPESIYCYNCSGEITLKQLEEYDGSLAGAVCPYCQKSLMFDSGTTKIGGFKGFSGGQSRGGGAGRDEPLNDETEQYFSQSFLLPNGKLSFPAEPVFSKEVDSFFKNNASILGYECIYTHPGTTSDYITPLTVSWPTMGMPRHFYALDWFFTVPYDGNYSLYCIYSINTGRAYYKDDSGKHSIGAGFSYSYSASGFNNLLKGAVYRASIGCVEDDFPLGKLYPLYDSIQEKYLSFSGSAYAYFIYDGIPDEYQPIESDILDTENKTITVNGDVVSYETIYQSGDTYIIYQDSSASAPAFVYVKDPQTGEVIGMSWYDPTGNCYYYTDFTAPDPTPTPAPTSAPGPTATPGSGPTATPDPGGDGGDGGDDGSGGGIWDTVAGALADLLGMIGKLIGGLLAGILELLTSVVGSLSQAIPLVNEFSAVIVQLYSFLPVEWQTLLTAAFSIFLILGVVRLFYKG